MWLVVDTNQAGLIPASLRGGRITDHAKGLTLPPYTLAEIVRRGEHERRETLNALRRHRVRIGLEPAQVFEWLRHLRQEQIASYEPFPPVDSELEVEYARLLNETAATVSSEAAAWSTARAADAVQFATRLRDQSKGARALIKDNRPAKPENVDELLAEMANGPDSFIGKLVLEEVFTPATVTDREHAYASAMGNAYLRSFFHALSYYLISVSRGWKDQRRNELQLHRDVDRNDWPDLTLALYVGEGDCVISADGLHKSLFTDFGVPIVTASEL